MSVCEIFWNVFHFLASCFFPETILNWIVTNYAKDKVPSSWCFYSGIKVCIKIWHIENIYWHIKMKRLTSYQITFIPLIYCWILRTWSVDKFPIQVGTLRIAIQLFNLLFAMNKKNIQRATYVQRVVPSTAKNAKANSFFCFWSDGDEGNTRNIPVFSGLYLKSHTTVISRGHIWKCFSSSFFL